MTGLYSGCEAASYHEAGHAVASWRQGDGIGFVSIIPGVDQQSGRRFDGRFGLVSGSNRTIASGWGHRHIVTIYAGSAAQSIYDPNSHVQRCANGDFEDARRFAVTMCRSRESELALLKWARAEARALVSENWQLIDCLARVLLRAGVLDGRSATAVLEAAEAKACLLSS